MTAFNKRVAYNLSKAYDNQLDKGLRLIFVELPKFKKSLLELKNLTDKWIYFLQEAASFDEIPESLGEISEIEQALNIANFINMTPEELEIVENRGIAMQDERGRIAYAEEQARLNQTIALVKLLITQRFGEVNDEISSQIEGLPLEDVEDLVKVFLSFNSLVDLESWLQERL
jgi:hypothetical protein